MTPGGRAAPAQPAAGGDAARTADLRARVLAAWAASPARFREDANAEDDLARGGYRDRLVVELAQNAVDAAARGGVPARLRLSLADSELRAANTGAPLDAAGVQALSTLRASAKRDGATVGRFGVGFASVLAVTDVPAVLSGDPAVSGGLGVRWSAEETRRLVAGVPGLADELARRDGHVPVLRLPFPDPRRPPAGWDTEVRLPLRDAAAEAAARRLLADVDPALLLALPGLVELVVEVDGRARRLTARPEGPDVLVDDDQPGLPTVTTRWRLARDGGQLPRHLLADRPVEERERTAWAVTWAVPVDGSGALRPVPADVAPVVRAPTPSDDPLSLPAVLVATLPLDPSRRRVAPGPLAGWVCDRAGAVLARLAESLRPGPETLALVPTGFAAGEVDALLRDAALTALRGTALLPAVDAAAGPLPGSRAVVLDGASPALVGLVAEAVPGLLPAELSAEGLATRLALLGARRLGLAEAVDAVAGLSRPPAWWHRLYDALDEALRSGRGRDAGGDVLGALPVPLVDGRLAAGPRGVVLADGDWAEGLDAGGARALGLRVAHPVAAHPLLARAGAVEATAAALLADPAVRAAVGASVDDADAGVDVTPLTDAVLGLVAATGLTTAELPWLAEVALVDDEGEPAPAGELLLPGGPLAEVVDADGPLRPVAPALLARHGADALAAVGVLRTFAVARLPDVLLDGPLDADLDGEAEWVEALLAVAAAADPDGGGPDADGSDADAWDGDAPPSVAEPTAVRDLDLVRADAWPRALALLAEPGLREHVVTPARLRLADGRVVEAPSYTGWWLSHAPVLGGRRPADVRLPDADPALAGLYDDLPAALAAGVDGAFLRAAGCRGSLADVLAVPAGAADLLARLADPQRPVGRESLRAVYAALPAAFADADLLRMPWPERLRGARDGRVEVVDVDDALVVDRPDLLRLVGRRAVLPVGLAAAEALAWTLDVERASEAAPCDVVSRPHRTLAWADVPGADLAATRLGARRPPTAVVAVHRGLTVTDLDGEDVGVSWRAVADVDHVEEAAGAEALGRALAWRLGAWPRRAAAVEALRAGESPRARADLEAEDDLDERP